MILDEKMKPVNVTLDDCILPNVYGELRKLAAKYLKAEPAGQTLSGTALVHEAFVRLNQSESAKTWHNTRHLIFSMALTMRRILVDRARCKNSQRRGGEFRRVFFDSVQDRLSDSECDSVEQLNEALYAFEKEHPAAAELINLWYYGGMTMSEAAHAVGISRSTAHRHWRFAKAWLACQIARQRGA